MAIYHNSFSIVTRSVGSSAVASSAYCGCTKMINEFDGRIHDYTRKSGFVYGEVALCEHANPEWKDSEKLWNAVEEFERDPKAQLARKNILALPNELSTEEHIELIRKYVEKKFTSNGIIAEWNIHSGHEHRANQQDDLLNGEVKKDNPHVHIQLTMRPIDENGNFVANKRQKMYVCKNQSGEEMNFTAKEFKAAVQDGWEKQYKYSVDGDPKGKKIWLTKYEKEHNEKYKDYERVPGQKDPKSVKFGLRTEINEKWDSKEFLKACREDWANQANTYLREKGVQEIDHRTLKEQGIDREPQIHIGPNIAQMEKKGIYMLNDRGEENRKIVEMNKYREQHRKQAEELDKDIKAYNADVIEFKKIKEQKNKQLQSRQPEPQQTDLKIKLETARQDVERTYEEFSKQKEVKTGLDHEIKIIKSKLYEADKLEKYLQVTEDNLGKINKLNPFKRTEVKELQNLAERYKREMKAVLGGESRENLMQRLRKLEKTLPKDEKNLADSEQKHQKAKEKFSYLKREEKRIQHKSDLKQAEVLHDKMKAGHKLSLNEMKLVNTHAQELNIKPIKIPEMKMPRVSKAMDLDLER